MKKTLIIIAVVVVLLLGGYYFLNVRSAGKVPERATAGLLLGTATDTNLGSFLVAPNGMTLYLYTKDTPGVSVCYEQCAINWPPYIVTASTPLKAVASAPGKIATTTRTDGTLQLTYNDVPLYYWIRDMKPGDTTGQNVGGVWFVVKP